jgi:hypothetical protein
MRLITASLQRGADFVEEFPRENVELLIEARFAETISWSSHKSPGHNVPLSPCPM